jgi:serine/threonine protein kinase
MQEEEIYIHNYKILEKLGKGAFSTVFKGIHRINKKIVAIKVEKTATTLKHESKILSYLNRELPGSPNIPILLWYGLYGNNVCLTTTFYKMSLQEYIEKIGKDTIKLIGLCEKLIVAIKQLHSAYIVHSDIKPDNFMVDERENVIIIDFGLSSLYYNVENEIYKENVKSVHLIGSAKYASYNLHLGNSVGPRDDLISIGYLFMTIFGIELPWSSYYFESELPIYHVMHPANVERGKLKRLDLIKNFLDETEPKQIVEHYLIPYLEAVYGLEYMDQPDYGALRTLFITLY